MKSFSIPVALQVTSLEKWILGAGVVLAFFLFVRLVLYWNAHRSEKKRDKARGTQNVEFPPAREETPASETLHEKESRELVQLDKLKNGFFENVTHELQTPLSWVVSSLETVLRSDLGPQDAAIRPRLEIAVRNVRLSLHLTNQLSNLTKLEAASIPLAVQRKNVVQFLQHIVDLFSPEVERLQIRLLFACSREKLEVFFDPLKLESILVNLISYSVMSTPAGGKILISLSVPAEESDPPNSIEISVRDTGIGMKTEALNQFPDLGTESNLPSMASRARIGLAVVDELIRLHRAKMQVSSVEGFGTSFSLHLPVSRSTYAENEMQPEGATATSLIPASYLLETLERRMLQKAEESKNEITDRSSRTNPVVLVVQTDPDVRSLIRDCLEEKYAVQNASDGRTGLKMAKKLIPDLILCDVNLPEMDGIALARQLKHNPRLFEIPVILLSSRNSSEARIEGWTVGADEFITGPIIPSELLARVDSLILSRKALRDRYAKRSLGQPEVIEIPSTEITFLNRVKELVTLHLENPSFSVGMLASELNISEAQLKRRMNALVGEPPVEYIRNFRLDRAAQLLDRKAGSVSEISFAVGFQNLSYFSKCFRERFGATPSQFGARVDIQTINSDTD